MGKSILKILDLTTILEITILCKHAPEPYVIPALGYFSDTVSLKKKKFYL